MKKAIVLTVLTLTSACTVQIGGAKAEPLPTTTTSTSTTSTTTTSTTSTTLPRLTDEDLYVLDVVDYTDLDLWYDDWTILEFGRTVCEYFDTGGTSAGLAEIIYDAGIANGTSEEIMLDFASAAGFAVSRLCPEHSSRV